MHDYKEDSEKRGQIRLAAEKLRSGGLLLYPTDTIWGLGCDALNPGAIEQLARLKQRPLEQPFLLLVNSVEMLKKYTRSVHPRIETLLFYHERPLTVLYDATDTLPPGLVSKEKKVAIRIINHGTCYDLIEEFGFPLVSTSANLHGEPFPKHFGEISSAVIQQVDYVLHPLPDEEFTGEPSVIAGFDKKGELYFIRE